MTAGTRLVVVGCLIAFLAGCSGASTRKIAPPTAAAGRSPGTPGTPGAPGAPSATGPPPAAQPAPGPAAPPPTSVGPARRQPEPIPTPPARAPQPPPAAVAQAPPPAAAPTPAAPRRFVMFNFDNADVEVVIQAAAEIVGFNYVIAPPARGRKVTVQTTGRIPSDEVFAVLLTILDVNGLTAVQSGNLYRVIPKEGATQSSLKTVVGNEPDPRIPGDEIVTQIVPLAIMSAPDAVALLRPFVPAQGNLSAHRDTNLVMITDTAANIRRLLGVLKLADVVVTSDELQIIPIQHADAQELAQILNQLFATGRVRVGAPAAPAPPAPPGAPRPPGTPGDAGAGERPLIVAERRSNTVIVQARRQEMETIRRLIRELDVDLYGGQRVFIHFAENAKAKDLVTTLDAIYGRGGAGAAPVPAGGPGILPGGPGAPPRPGAAPGPGASPGWRREGRSASSASWRTRPPTR